MATAVEEPKEAPPEFKMPVLHIQDRVVVSEDVTWKHPVPGFVVAFSPVGADIAIIGSRRRYLDCWYDGDPRITERPEVFAEESRGTFKLADSELAQRDIQATLASQQALLDQLAAQIGQLTSTKTRKPQTSNAVA